MTGRREMRRRLRLSTLILRINSIVTEDRPHVLIVEDEAPLVTMLRYNLESDGYRVSEAVDGEEALLLVAEDPPDLVLLDWMLPSLSGIEVCRRMRRSNPMRTVPIIMLTARGEESDRVRGLDAGADDYITKPFSPRELLARVRAVMRRHRARDRASANRVHQRGPARVRRWWVCLLVH